MGEYARRNSDKAEVKIGTCENMYYLRYEDRSKVSRIPGCVDPAKDSNLRFRLPFPDEDHFLPGTYESGFRGAPLCGFTSDHTADDVGILQIHHNESGLLLNIPCHHGERLPEIGHGMKAFWNGKGHSYELVAVKNTENGLRPVIQCRHCEKMWLIVWSDVLPYITCEKFKKRLAAYEAAEELA